MERVEKKKARRGKSRAVWIAAAAGLFAVCLGLALYFGNRPEEEKMPVRQDHSGVLLQHDAGEIAAVTVVRRGEEAWTVEQDEDGSLRLQGAEGWTVSEYVGGKLLDALATLEYEDILTEDAREWKDHPEEFGLDEPLVTAVCRWRDGTLTTVRIGNAIEVEEGSAYYMSVDREDKLYAASAGTMQDLSADKALLHPVEQPEILRALLDRITLSDADGNPVKEWRLNGKLTDPEAGSEWIVSVPFTYPADEEIMDTLRSAAENLRLGAWIADTTEENLEKYGLKTPRTVLDFHMAAGSTGTVSEAGVYDVVDREERSVRLEIGSNRSDTSVYARYEDSICTMSLLTLSTVLDAEPEETIAKYPVIVPYGSLAEVTVETDEGRTEYLRTGSGEDSKWLKNGAEVSAEAMEAAYSRLLVVVCSGKLPDGTVPGKAHTKYTFRTQSGGTHVVELCDYDGMHDMVTVDGFTRFYLIRGGMTELP